MAQACTQCKREMSPIDEMLGPVCGTCAKENHKRAVKGKEPKKA